MNWARAFFGILIVAAGAMLLFDNLGMIEAGEIFSQWWPAAIIVGGALTFAANPRHWIVPMLLVLGGGVVLLRTTGVIDTIELLLPAILIVVGLLVLFGNGLGSRTTSSDTTLNSFNLFSGSTWSAIPNSSRVGRSAPSSVAPRSICAMRIWRRRRGPTSSPPSVAWRSRSRAAGESTSGGFPSLVDTRTPRAKRV